MLILLTVTLLKALASDAPEVPYVTVLGIAQDAGHPQIGCTKAHCVSAFNNPLLGHRVASLGIVDPTSGKYWLVDATPDLPSQLHDLEKFAPLADLDGIFLTHAHIGHYTGLMYLGREAAGAEKVPVYAMPKMQEFLRSNGPWSQLVSLNNIELRDCTPAVQITDQLRVEPLRVPHRDEYSETVGYRIVGPEKAVLYIPDIDKWEAWDTPLEEALSSVDVAYVDGTFFDGDELPGRDMRTVPHPLITETMNRLARLPRSVCQKVRFIHLNHTNPTLDPSSDAHRSVQERGFRLASEGELIPL